MLKENILNPFFNYIFPNETISNLCVMLFTCYFGYLIVNLVIGGLKKWYKLFKIS